MFESPGRNCRVCCVHMGDVSLATGDRNFFGRFVDIAVRMHMVVTIHLYPPTTYYFVHPNRARSCLLCLSDSCSGFTFKLSMASLFSWDHYVHATV